MIKFLKYDKKEDIKIVKSKTDLNIQNKSNTEFIININRTYLNIERKCLIIQFIAKNISGESCKLYLYNRKKEIKQVICPDETMYMKESPRIYSFAISIPAHSACKIQDILVKENDFLDDQINEYFQSDTLIIAPGYPSFANKYFWAFVHSRAREYKKEGMDFDIAAVQHIANTTIYNFESIKVCKTDFLTLRNLLQLKHYKRIIVHFFMDEIGQILLATDLTNTRVYIYGHSGDLLYRDINILSTPYFSTPKPLSSDQESYSQWKDRMIQKFIKKPNVKFIFGTNWAKQRSQSENHLLYYNSDIIPCPVDAKIFNYKHKTSELRKNIIIIRKFDNINTYAIDIDVKIILELSKRAFFSDLNFTIYGDGDSHERLLSPIKHFKNVKIFKRFLSHEEMAKVHEQNGIALFATRYETQGIAAAEAAMSGLVVITNNVAAVPEVFDDNLGILCPKENYKAMADKVEYLYNHPEEFCTLSQKIHDCVVRTCGYKQTILKELNMFDQDDKVSIKNHVYKEQEENIILSIIVPAYNVERWLINSIHSVIDIEHSNKIEVLIINDGSKDKTESIGKSLQELTTVNGKSIVKLINKENGGHGSTINKGIELAKGKYIKMMDGDEYYDGECLDKLLLYLENEDSDIVLTDYVEDWAPSCRLVPVLNYEHLQPGEQYNIEDLCFEGYGFNRFGPILHTSTFKTQMLRDANFKISEHCFYVDMELNTFAFMASQTVTYYPLQLYIYFLGREGQSVSPESFKKNYKQHEHVTLKLVKAVEENKNISKLKKKCLFRNIILPMVETQYFICTEYLDDNKPFLYFDECLKSYRDIYNDPFIANERVSYHRRTKGKTIISKKYRRALSKFKIS